MIETGFTPPFVDPLLAEIELLRKQLGMTQTGFGYLVLRDASLIGRLRNGRILNKRSRTRVSQALQALRVECAPQIEEWKRKNAENGASA